MIGKERIRGKPPAGRTGRRRHGRGASLPASPYSFVNGTTSLGASGPPASWTWCLTPCKALFFRQRAPRLSGPAGLRRAGRGASLPAIPYSFVRGHHVHEIQQAFGEPDVVLHSPQSLIFSSPSTTSTRSSGPSANRTWCFTPRKSLFFRRRAPRPSGPAGLRRTGRGASLPAIPYSFVAGHHVSWTQRASGEPDVVLHSPQALILSSPGTTSLGPSGSSAMRTWCFTPRNPLFLRPGAPRPRDPEAHRVPTLKTKAEGNSRPRISLPLTVGGNFPLFPTAPSSLGAAPIGKHFRPASFPEVLPIPNPRAHSIRPGLNGLSSPQNRNGNASRSGSAALLFHHNQKGCALLKSICFSVRHIPPISTKAKGSGTRGARFLLLSLFEGNPRPSPAGDFRLLFSTENP